MKNVTELKFDRIIKEGFYEILKPLEFKKKRNNFYLKLKDLGQIINIQKSAWGTKNDISYTINTGLFLPEHWAGMTYNQGKKTPTFPNEVDCLIRRRIGELRNQGDTWYTVTDEIDVNDLIGEMKINVTQYILPFFERTKTKDDLLKLLDSEKSTLSILSKLVTYGELKLLDKAKTEYQSVLNQNINPSFLETVREYGKKYCLD